MHRSGNHWKLGGRAPSKLQIENETEAAKARPEGACFAVEGAVDIRVVHKVYTVKEKSCAHAWTSMRVVDGSMRRVAVVARSLATLRPSETVVAAEVRMYFDNTYKGCHIAAASSPL